MPSHKTFRMKRFITKKMKQNRPIPQWIRMKTSYKQEFVAMGRVIKHRPEFYPPARHGNRSERGADHWKGPLTPGGIL